jgi:hypothetical protein
MKYSSRKSYYISNRIENRKDNPIWKKAIQASWWAFFC